jgi:hypothetical protein
LEDETGKVVETIFLPERGNLEVREGDKISPGTMIAKLAREVGGTQDITGGLPRVTEIFEARTPRHAASLASIAGIVRIGEAQTWETADLRSTDRRRKVTSRPRDGVLSTSCRVTCRCVCKTTTVSKLAINWWLGRWYLVTF